MSTFDIRCATILLFLRAPLIGAACAALIGCGSGDGMTRYQVSGEVRYKGQPVKIGTITFEPSAGAGKEAPTGYAVIRDGRFSTEPGRGAGAGSYVARIYAGDGQSPARPAVVADPEGPPPTAKLVFGRPLLEDYGHPVQLPAKDSELEIKLP